MGKPFKPWPPKPAPALPLDGMNGDFVNHESPVATAGKKGKASVAPGEAKPSDKKAEKKAEAAPAADKKAEAAPAADKKAEAAPAADKKAEAKPAKK